MAAANKKGRPCHPAFGTADFTGRLASLSLTSPAHESQAYQASQEQPSAGGAGHGLLGAIEEGDTSAHGFAQPIDNHRAIGYGYGWT
jgi:hypothetical protein